MDTKGGKLRWGGDGGELNWAIGIDMYTLMCIKLMPNKNLQYKKRNKTTTTKKISLVCLIIFYFSIWVLVICMGGSLFENSWSCKRMVRALYDKSILIRSLPKNSLIYILMCI